MKTLQNNTRKYIIIFVEISNVVRSMKTVNPKPRPDLQMQGNDFALDVGGGNTSYNRLAIVVDK